MLARAIAFASVVWSSSAVMAADDFPSRPIHIVVPFAAGGTADPLARGIADEIQKNTGKSVVVESRAGGGGNVGELDVARAEPDGYTVLLGANNNFVVNQFTMPKTSIDPTRELSLMTILVDQPEVVYVKTDFPAKTLRELLDYIKAHPGQVNFASPGAGSAPHLASELLASLYDLNMVHVPYRGGAAAISALVAGDVQLYIASLSVGKGQLEAGNLRALAVTAPNRLKVIPNVPTMAEAGAPEYVLSNWWALAGPKDVPSERTEWLREEFVKAINQPDLKSHLENIGFLIQGSTTKQFEDRVRQESAVYQSMVTKRGLIME
jgi:tripartite-type tricarboxylate transporter receptor subunit TctC